MVPDYDHDGAIPTWGPLFECGIRYKSGIPAAPRFIHDEDDVGALLLWQRPEFLRREGTDVGVAPEWVVGR